MLPDTFGCEKTSRIDSASLIFAMASLTFSRIISPAKTNLFSPWTLHLYTQSFPMAKVFKHLIFKHFFDQRTVKEPSSETLLHLSELVLTLNCFSFAGSYYKQINGVAMGTRMGTSYSNLFVGYVEHQFFKQYNGPKPELYCRYIDDCIGAISSSRDLDQFIPPLIPFIRLLNIPGKFRNLHWLS